MQILNSISKLNQAIKKGTIHYGVLHGNKKTSNTYQAIIYINLEKHYFQMKEASHERQHTVGLHS